VLDLAPENRRYDGKWFTVPLTNPLYFKGGTRFGIVVGATGDVGYPAGMDFSAQVPDNSFYFDFDFNQFLNINKIAGFETAAFLIRAVGAEIAGGNLPPSANAAISKVEARINETLTFDASNSSDPDGQIIVYLWNFGDGNSSNQKIATHAYAQAGAYEVTLTVIDDAGAKGQSSGQITITTETMTRLAVNPESGTIFPGGSQTITVTFDAQGLAEGSYQGELNLASNGGNRTIPVRIRVSNTVEVNDERAELPRTFHLEQNYPNPFWSEATSPAFGGGNLETNIRYALPDNGNVVLAVFDLSGRCVATLASGTQAAGEHVVRWSGRDDAGNRVSSGIYFYRLDATLPNGAVATLTKKLSVLK
jgi:PKD repeat protein